MPSVVGLPEQITGWPHSFAAALEPGRLVDRRADIGMRWQAILRRFDPAREDRETSHDSHRTRPPEPTAGLNAKISITVRRVTGRVRCGVAVRDAEQPLAHRTRTPGGREP